MIDGEIGRKCERERKSQLLECEGEIVRMRKIMRGIVRMSKIMRDIV